MGLAAFLGVVTWLALTLFTPSTLELAGASPESPLGLVAASYLRIRAFSLPASLMNTVAIGTFRGFLDTSTALWVVLGQSMVDCALNFALVFGVPQLGIPALGVEGAALATVISIWLACGTFCVILGQRGWVRWEEALKWPFALDEMREMVVGGTSQLLRTLSLQAVLLNFTRVVVGLDAGGLNAAVHQVALRTWFFALFALDSIAVAAQGLIPTALAGGGPRLARSVAQRLLLWGFGGGVAAALILAAGSDAVPALFTEDAAVRAAASPFIVLVAFLQPLAGLVFTWDGIFQGLSDFSYLAVAMAISAAFTLLALQLDVLHVSLEGVWACFTIFLVGRAAGLAWRFWGDDGPLADRKPERE